MWRKKNDLEEAIDEVRAVLELAGKLTDDDWHQLEALSFPAREVLVRAYHLSEEQRHLISAILFQPPWPGDPQRFARGALGLGKLGAIKLNEDQVRKLLGA